MVRMLKRFTNTIFLTLLFFSKKLERVQVIILSGANLRGDCSDFDFNTELQINNKLKNPTLFYLLIYMTDISDSLLNVQPVSHSFKYFRFSSHCSIAG